MSAPDLLDEVDELNPPAEAIQRRGAIFALETVLNNATKSDPGIASIVDELPDYLPHPDWAEVDPASETLLVTFNEDMPTEFVVEISVRVVD